MARPVDIREESAISTFRLGVSSGISPAVLCKAIVLVKLEMGRDMVRQTRVTENMRGFIQYWAGSDLRLPVVQVVQSSSGQRGVSAIDSASYRPENGAGAREVMRTGK